MKRFKFLNSDRGFTLMELLVVIAIIGILASLLMANFVNVRQKSRDAQRKSNLRQVQSALELYRADNGSYPATSPGLKNCPATGTKTDFGNASATTNPCGTVYMKKIPSDPSGSSYWNAGDYYYNQSGTGYTLASCIENSNDSDPNTTTTSPGGTGTCSGKYYVLTDL